MVDIIKWMISVAFTLPLLSLFFLFLIVQVFVKNKKKSILWTVDLSTFLFIMSVHFHLLTIFEQSFLIYIILGLMSLTGVFYYLDYKRSNTPSMKKASKKVWRLSFLFFIASYLILTVYGMVSEMINNVFT
jgi:hypothetical protein